MLTLTFIIFISMVLGRVWLILIQPDYLFDFVGPWIDKLHQHTKVVHLLTCSVCMSGQFATWIYLFYSIHCCTWNIIEHLSVIVITIYFSAIESKILKLYE